MSQTKLFLSGVNTHLNKLQPKSLKVWRLRFEAMCRGMLGFFFVWKKKQTSEVQNAPGL